MPRKRFAAEEIITKLREADVLLAQSRPVSDVCKQLMVSEKTYFRWRKEYGGLKLDQVRRMKELEQENTRLRKAVSDLTIDNQILKEVAKGNF